MISVLVLPLPQVSNLFCIHMVSPTKGKSHLVVVVLDYLIVLLRVCDISVS